MSALVLGVSPLGCDKGDAQGEAPAAASGDPSAPASDDAAKAEAEPKIEAKAPDAAPTKCTNSIKVTGAETFEHTKKPNAIALVEKKHGKVIAVQVNAATIADHPYMLFLFAPAEPAADVSFNDEDKGLDRLSLTMLNGEDYTAFATHKAGKDPGTLTMTKTKTKEGWFEVHGKALLSAGKGKEVEVQLDLSSAYPPARCP